MITKKNYFKAVKRVGIENLPLELRQAHLVIVSRTDMGKDWGVYEKDKDIKQIIDLAFEKLDDFIKRRKKGLAGIPGEDYAEEMKFFNILLKWNGSSATKTMLLTVIEELQSSIVNRKIRKVSPFAAEIKQVQDYLVETYNGMKRGSLKFILPVSLEEKLKEAVEKAKETEKPATENQLPEKVGPVDLRGIEQAGEEQIQNQVISSVEFSKMKFDPIGLKGKWLTLIGDPCKGFSAMVFGKPKMGKSCLCVDFAGYLARNHGTTLYVAKEEKLDATLQKKLNDANVAHPNLFVSDFLPEDLSGYDFIFLDSVNKLGLSPKDLDGLKNKYPDKSFISVFQTTKLGIFRGGNQFQHDADVIIEVTELGKAVQFGRFNQGGEISIFEDSLQGTEEDVMLAGQKKKSVRKRKSKNENIYTEYYKYSGDHPQLIKPGTKVLDESGKERIIAEIDNKTLRLEGDTDWINISEVRFPKMKPDWTRPEHLPDEDIRDLRILKKLYEEGKFKKAFTFASNLDTAVREEIPARIWKEIGGELTPAGEARLKKEMEKTQTKGEKKEIDYSDELSTLKELHEDNIGETFTDQQFNEIFELAEKSQPGLYRHASDFESDFMGLLMALDEATSAWKKKNPSRKKEEEKQTVNEKTMEENSKKQAQDLKKYDSRPDDLNPNYIFSLTATQLLTEALKGEFDIQCLVRMQLANRGVDENGLWVGFDKARAIHKIEK